MNSLVENSITHGLSALLGGVFGMFLLTMPDMDPVVFGCVFVGLSALVGAVFGYSSDGVR